MGGIEKITHKMAKRIMKRSMKARKSMKKHVMRKKKRVSKSGSKAMVYHGTRLKTNGGLKKADLRKNKHGKIVSIKASAASVKRSKKWMTAVAAARRAVG